MFKYSMNTHTHTLLTDEHQQQQAAGLQLGVGVAEGVTEGGVDDHEEHAAADGAERKLPALQALPEETAARLTQDQRHYHGHEELREDGGEGDGGRRAQLEEDETQPHMLSRDRR